VAYGPCVVWPRLRVIGRTDYAAKRTATGGSRREIMRLLQRYIVRELYPLIISALQPVRPSQHQCLAG
jgi:hypothetical protein